MYSLLANRSRVLTVVLGCSAGVAGCTGGPPGTEDARETEDSSEVEEALSTSKCPDEVPEVLLPKNASDRLWFVLRGVGAQIYTCTETAAGFEWILARPDADLLNGGSQVVGTHYEGPTWESIDGSTVVAARLEQAPSPDPNAIAWLLLGATSHTGSGKMSHVTSIQRLSTVGGRAPATGCDGTTVGDQVEIAYAADYFFYRAGNGNPDGNPRCGD